MTDQSAQEPTMEEILASIRRIISEDDAPAEAAAPAPEPEAVPAGARGGHFVTGLAQVVFEDRQNVLLVFDDKNSGHPGSPGYRAPVTVR